MTPQEAQEQFRESLQIHHYSKRTIPDYRYQVRYFFEWLHEHGIHELSEITRDTLHQYQQHLFYLKVKGKSLSLGTQVHHLTALKTFFRFLAKEQILLYDPASDLELPKRKKGLPRGIMTQREVLKILERPDLKTPLGLRDRAILELLYSTGIRNEELRNLSILDVDFSGGSIFIREGKNAKSRLIPLGEVAAFFMARYLEEARPMLTADPNQNLLFVSKNGKKLTSACLIWTVHKYVKEAKIEKNIGPHSFRHTCATHLLRGKADLRHIQELLGHASVATTQIYTKVEVSDLKRVHERCHPREKQWKKQNFFS